MSVDVVHIVGHRGYGKNPIVDVAVAHENHPASFALGFAAGMSGVETDIHAARDSRDRPWTDLPIHHDTMLPDGTLVYDHDLDTLRRDYGMPTLGEVIAAVPKQTTQGHRALFNAELKNGFDQEENVPDRMDQTVAEVFAPAIPELAERFDLRVSAFDPGLIAELTDNLPTHLSAFAWLTEYKPGFRTHSPTIEAATAQVLSLGVHGLHAQTELFGLRPGRPITESERRMARHAAKTIHEAGLYALAWCPEPDEALELMHHGVHVCVNDVPRTVELAQQAGIWTRPRHGGGE